jgi:hypothetical protein
VPQTGLRAAVVPPGRGEGEDEDEVARSGAKAREGMATIANERRLRDGERKQRGRDGSSRT